MKMYPTPEMILEAAVTLRGVARQTPVLPFGRQGGTLFLKAENLQETSCWRKELVPRPSPPACTTGSTQA